jgi:hypothetical protein
MAANSTIAYASAILSVEQTVSEEPLRIRSLGRTEQLLDSAFGARNKEETMENQRKLCSYLPAALLLCASVAWGQSFSDQVGGHVLYCGNPSSYSVTGTAADLYSVTGSTGTLSCTLGKVTDTVSSSTVATLGHNLFIFASDAASGGGAMASAGGYATDSLILTPPAGFTGTFLNFQISENYTLNQVGGTGSAAACWLWTPLTTEFCVGTITHPSGHFFFSTTVVARKNPKTGKFVCKIWMGAATQDAVDIPNGQGKSTVTIGTPQFSKIPKGWKYKWASGT